MNTRNGLFAFVGGFALGAMAAVGVMKKQGYMRVTENEREWIEEDRKPVPTLRDDGSSSDSVDGRAWEEDKPSFEMNKTIDTHKVSYHTGAKPDLEELAKKYTTEGAKKFMAEQESPEEDIPDPDEEDDDAEAEADALTYHILNDGCPETEGYGHIVKILPQQRKNDFAYLITDEWLGEVYLVEELTYYSRDDVLVDVNDAVVDDVDHVVGTALNEFGKYGVEESKVYVRNITMELEYEITKVDGYFAAHLYGIPDDVFEKTGCRCL